MIYMLVIIIHGSQAISKFLPNPILQEKCRLKKMERAVKRENTCVKVREREVFKIYVNLCDKNIILA